MSITGKKGVGSAWRPRLMRMARTCTHVRLFEPAAEWRRAVRAANSTNQRDIARVHGVLPERMCEIGISDATCVSTRREVRRGRAIRIFGSGVFRHHKAPALSPSLVGLRRRT